MKDHIVISDLTKFMVNKHCVMDIGTTSLILRQRPLNKLQLALSGESGQFDGAMVLIFCVHIPGETK